MQSYQQSEAVAMCYSFVLKSLAVVFGLPRLKHYASVGASCSRV